MAATEVTSTTGQVRVPLSQKLAYGAGGFAEAFMADAMLSALFPFYNIVLKVDALVLGGLLVLPRIWDAITDPIMGHISDNTRTRWGRRHPYIALGSVFLAVVTFLVWNPPESLAPHLLVWYLFALLFVADIANTVTLTPYQSLGAELAVEYDERSRVMAFRAGFSRIGALLSNLALWFAFLPIFSGPRQGFAAVGVILALFPFIALWIVILGVRPPKLPSKEAAGEHQSHGFLRSVAAVSKNGPFLIVAAAGLLFIVGVFSSMPLVTYINFFYVCSGDESSASFFSSVYGATWHASGFVLIPVVTWISTRIGKQKTFALGMASFGVMSLLSWFFFNPAHPYLQLAFPVLIGFGLATFLVMPISMLADVCDYDELRTGRRREGVYFGFFTFVYKVGFSFTSLINGASLWWAGFSEGLDMQAPETITRLRLLLMFLPAVIIAIAGIVLMKYPLTHRRVEEMQAVLREKRAASTPAPTVAEVG